MLLYRSIMGSGFSKASLPSNWNLWARMSSRSAVRLRACPPGYMTSPESYAEPSVSTIWTLVGMPSGYLLSYSSPPWANSIFSMSARVRES